MIEEIQVADMMQDDVRLIAIKKLFSPDETEFKRELTILTALGSKTQKHPHLINLLATYRHRQKYHLMFPYADANLRKYWDDRLSPSFDAKTVYWSLKQMTGIADALHRIHNFMVTFSLSPDGQLLVQNDTSLNVGQGEEWFGRHGDIKPDNILWFNQSSQIKDESGILQIADFGLGKFHGRESRSRINPNTVISPTYAPPECKLRYPVSRAYDIWSLGCLYLEFITWLLKGSAEIEGFANFRGREATSTGINDDNFFTIINDYQTDPKAIVREQVVDWVNQLHGNEKCSALIHDLLDLVMTQLLVVDSKKRITAQLLHQELNGFLGRAKIDEKYLLEPAPRPSSLPGGVHLNPAAPTEIITTSPKDDGDAPGNA